MRPLPRRYHVTSLAGQRPDPADKLERALLLLDVATTYITRRYVLVTVRRQVVSAQAGSPFQPLNASSGSLAQPFQCDERDHGDSAVSRPALETGQC